MENKRFLFLSKPQFWWSFVILASCLVYFTGISHESIWWDESFSAFMAEHSPSEIMHFIPTDNHPPLYYLLLHLAVSVFGNSALALRLPSVLGAIGLVALGAGPVRRILGNKTALLYSGITLLTPVILIYAHEARMYSLTNFSVTACALFGFLAVEENRFRDWVLFGLFNLVSGYLHYYGLMAAFFVNLFLFIWILLKNRDHLKAYIIMAGIVILGYIPWIRVLLQQIQNVSKGFWVSAVSFESIFNAMIQPFAYKEIFPSVTSSMVILLLLSLGVIITGLVIVFREKVVDRKYFAIFILGVYICTFVTPIIISQFSRPIFYERYIIVLDGLFLLLFSLGLSLLPHKWLQISSLAIYAILNIFTIKNVYTQYFNYPMKEVAAYLQDVIKPGDLIVTSEQYSMGPALYYFPQATHYYSNNSVEKQWEQVLEPLAPRLHKDDEREELLSTHKSFWYINCNTGSTKNIATILKGIKGWELDGQPRVFEQPYARFNFTAAKYTYTGQEQDLKQGSLNLHFTGLKPSGNLLILLYVKAPMDENPFHSYYANFTDTEMTFPIDGLEFGDYALVAYHDENVNYYPDYDRTTDLPKEGIGLVNWEKLDPSAVQASFTYENLKFPFHEKEKTVEITMFYPPFTMLSKK